MDLILKCPELEVLLLIRRPVTAPLRAPCCVENRPALLRRRRPGTQRRRWVWARRAVERGSVNTLEDSLHGGTHCSETAQWVPRRLARGPGVLVVPSQALDLFADFQLRTLESSSSKNIDPGRYAERPFLSRKALLPIG